MNQHLTNTSARNLRNFARKLRLAETVFALPATGGAPFGRRAPFLKGLTRAAARLGLELPTVKNVTEARKLLASPTVRNVLDF